MQPEATAPSYTHDAFISYSRRNEEFAQALQRALENFKPPKDLKAPQRYLDVFRDKDDFNAGEYFENLEKNLKLSDKLIVICSPEARASDFVNDEIRRFAQIRGKDHIIPILLAGIPNNEAKPGQEKEMAFPEALYEVMQMPLAVNYLNFDVNKDKITKGVFSDAWYTTLANVYEISRSEVEQREKRRRVRRRKITVSVLTASVAVLSVLLVFTLISKREADTQRNRAEDALAGETRAKDDAEAKRKEAVLARNDAEERRKEAVQQREIAEAKTKEAQRERWCSELSTPDRTCIRPLKQNNSCTTPNQRLCWMSSPRSTEQKRNFLQGSRSCTYLSSHCDVITRVIIARSRVNPLTGRSTTCPLPLQRARSN